MKEFNLNTQIEGWFHSIDVDGRKIMFKATDTDIETLRVILRELKKQLKGSDICYCTKEGNPYCNRCRIIDKLFGERFKWPTEQY